MVEHQFGGEWTIQKLKRLEKYLPAYTTIFKSNPKAQFLKTVYVDAFAGTGYVNLPHSANTNISLFEEFAESEVQEELKGSARIALDTEPSFDHYIFIEKEAEYATELHRLKNQHHNSGLSIQIEQSDARTFLPRWCETQDWNKTRAVIFLDPYSSQADWTTIEAISKGKVDLWLLWPIGQVINRLLTTKKMPPETWSEALTRAFGTDAWKTQFYASSTSNQLGLFGEEEFAPVKITDFRGIERFFIERLETCFDFVAQKPLYLTNSQNTPMYLLCFAAQNATAVKIAQDILKD